MQIRHIVAVFVCLLLTVGVASAGYKSKHKQGPCAEDVKKLCSGVKPGEGRIYQCLMSHETEINPACRDQLVQAKARFDQFVQSCKTDAEQQCKGVKPGQGRILSCLKSHEANLSPACREEFTRAHNDKTLNQ